MKAQDDFYHLMNGKFRGEVWDAVSRYARRIVQPFVGLYMLIYLGVISWENMQIEGLGYYLFTGVFEAVTIHYAVFGSLLSRQGW